MSKIDAKKEVGDSTDLMNQENIFSLTLIVELPGDLHQRIQAKLSVDLEAFLAS
jgi:hypothetical protein